MGRILDKHKSWEHIKVGAFFLGGITIAIFTFISMKEFIALKGTYSATVMFEFAEGLRTASPVRFCGVDVGEVKHVEIKNNNDKPVVYVEIKVLDTVKIPKGSYFFINSLSLFGEKYLEITPPAEVVSNIKEGDILKGISPIPLFNVFATFTETMEKVKLFIEEGKIKTSLEKTIANIEAITVTLKDFAGVLNSKDGTIGKLIHDDSLYKVAEEFVSDLKEHPWKLLHKPKEKKKKK